MSKPKSKFMRRLPLVGIFLLMTLGICFFMYPILGNWYTQYTSDNVIRTYNETIQEIGIDSVKKMEKEAEEYNEALSEQKTDRLAVYSYKELLNVRDTIGYVEIPKIDVNLPIYHGLDDAVLQKGIGHMEGTSLPVGGASTHSVLAGHTGLPSSKLFTDLDLMETGDYFYIHVLDKVMKYKVDQIKVVLPTEANDIQIEKGKDYVTLLTCTPYGINDHRLLVRGVRVPEDTETPENTNPWPSIHKEIVKLPARTILWYAAVAVIGFVILMIIIILIFPSFKRHRKKKSAPESESTDENSQP